MSDAVALPAEFLTKLGVSKTYVQKLLLIFASADMTMRVKCVQGATAARYGVRGKQKLRCSLCFYEGRNLGRWGIYCRQGPL